MGKWANGLYAPKNPAKYVGKHAPRYRSSWEFTFMQFCDNHENVMHWASEPFQIPYRNPFTGKQTVYVPDFFVVYQNKLGHKIAEVVEIKPRKQSVIEGKGASQKDKAVVALNHAKWAAAKAWCVQQNITFRVINENDIFRNGKA